ncbi:MAG: hypothetical protein J5486_01160 [Bacteroidaceae bacterium]|nr:hypothetical protein [Bacteroidaceae bacterium]
MKKIAFMFVAAMAMTFAACGGNATSEAAAEDTTAVEGEAVEVVEEVVEEADTTAVEADTTAVEVVEAA